MVHQTTLVFCPTSPLPPRLIAIGLLGNFGSIGRSLHQFCTRRVFSGASNVRLYQRPWRNLAYICLEAILRVVDYVIHKFYELGLAGSSVSKSMLQFVEQIALTCVQLWEVAHSVLHRFVDYTSKDDWSVIGSIIFLTLFENGSHVSMSPFHRYMYLMQQLPKNPCEWVCNDVCNFLEYSQVDLVWSTGLTWVYVFQEF